MTSVMESGPVRMDVDRHVVTVRNAQVQLPLKEFELLEFLLRNAGRVLTRMQLIDRVWGSDYVGDTKTLDVHVKRLRAKVEVDPANPTHIVTVRGPRLQVRAGRLARAGLATALGVGARRARVPASCAVPGVTVAGRASARRRRRRGRERGVGARSAG